MKHKTKVIYNNELRYIYDIYPDNMISLCILDLDGYHYFDTEDDELISINEIELVKNKTKQLN